MSHVRLANAFPLPITIPVVGPSEVGFDTLYPVGFSLQEIIKFYWRVRTWKFTGRVFVPDPQAPNGSTYEPKETTTRLRCAATGELCVDERDLLTPEGLSAYVENTDVQEDSQSIFAFGQCKRVGNAYYPYISASEDLGGGTVSEGYGFTFVGIAYGPSDSHPERRVLEIDDYWPYTGANGQPIYNTATGATLIDPGTAPYP